MGLPSARALSPLLSLGAAVIVMMIAIVSVSMIVMVIVIAVVVSVSKDVAGRLCGSGARGTDEGRESEHESKGK